MVSQLYDDKYVSSSKIKTTNRYTTLGVFYMTLV